MAKKTDNPTDIQLEKTGAYRDALAPYRSDFRSKQNAELERINEMNQNIYGESGQLENFNTGASEAMRRLAAQYAMRGMLQSGGYGGKERGAAVQTQKQQAGQRKQIEQPYLSAVQSESLGQSGLTQVDANPNARVKMREEFDWLTTNAGQAARARALAEARNSWLAGRTAV